MRAALSCFVWMMSDDGQSVVDMNCPMDDVWPRADLSHLNVDYVSVA